MVRTLSTFYQSKDWRNLLKILKLERLNGQGHLICEYCGKPIVSSYDCIGHHVVNLTEENVNDVNVSLNPNNVQLIHHRCHNFIHNKLGYQERQVFLVYGAPLSGKSKFVKEAMNVGDLVLDMDSIWECVSGSPRYIKPPRLNAVAFGVRDQIMDAVKYRRGKWLNAYVIGGYPLCSERERLVRSMGAREIFIDTSKEECLDRLEIANDRRNKKEWTRFIEEWFERYSPTL